MRLHSAGKVVLACCFSPAWGQDVTPPVLQSLSFSPTSINVTSGPQNVIVTARIADNISGVANSPFAFYSPAGPYDSQVQGGTFGASNLISGNANNGVYQVTVTFPQYSQPGTWYISYVQLYDQVGNLITYQEQDLINLGFPTTLQVASSGADVTPPVLRSLAISPTLIDVTNGPQTVTVTARITDDISGVANSSFFAFYSPPGPSGNQVQMGTLGASDRISGNANDGMYQATVTFPAHSQVGTWFISYLRLIDQVGNTITYQQTDLINLGFPTTLQVTEAPYITVLSNPPGRTFTLSGAGCANTGTFSTPYTTSGWTACTIQWTSPDRSTPNTLYLFQNWSDGNTQNPRTVTPNPSVATTYTANFETEYQLTTQAAPVAGGSVTPASGFYAAGTAVPITAIPASGYSFTGWTGSVASSSSSSTTVTMSGPETVVANFFTSLVGITFQTNPPGLLFSVDGGAAQTAPQTVLLAQGPHIIAVATPQPGGPATQYVFASWSDGGAVSHSINVTSAATYTASFTPQYQSGFAFSTINFPGSTNTEAYGVNNSGQIVGEENGNGFLLSGGTYTTFNATPGLPGTLAEGINSSGQIVGLNLASGGGFLLSAGTFTAIIVPGSDSGTTNAIGISDSGQIVGTFLKGGVEYGFLLSGGTYTTITAPGAVATVAYGINNSGQIVGWYTYSGGNLGFLLSGGNYTLLSFPGSGSTNAFGINNNGQIVGQYSMYYGGPASGFLWQGGTYTDINVPNSASTMAMGINDAGQIVGVYGSNGTHLGFSAAQNTEEVSIREYPAIPSGPPGFLNNALGAITAGPDGAMWFTGVPSGGPFNSLELGRITTAGVTSFFMEGASPSGDSFGFGIAAGPDGALWFTANIGDTGSCGRTVCTVDDPEIGRITTAGAFSEYNLGNPSGPPGVNGITAGPDGALWFSDGGLNEIGRITTSGVITLYPVPTPNSVLPMIAAGPDGALWFTEATANQIGRITTAGVVTEYPIPTTASSPFGIAAGPDGALWFTETSGNKIGRISTGGVIAEYPLPTAGAAPIGIALGPDGALWFAESKGNNIGRITVLGTITEYPVPTPSSGPMGTAAGPDGAIWFTETSGNVGQIVTITNPTPPILSVSKTHEGSFAQGQSNATYSVTVSNQAAATPTTGTVTVNERLPTGLTLVSMAGAGWSCTGNNCERSDVLAAGQSYPAITVTASVAANATSPQVNQVIVWGGGSVNSSASDPTTITAPAPALTITKTHTGNFTQGQTNATYALTVANTGGAPSMGAVKVTDTPPSGLTLVSMAGPPPCNATNCGGWTCTGKSCMRSDGLAPDASYPAIIVTVNVAANATSPQVNTASVSGGGSPPASASDSTTITAAQAASFFAGEQDLGSGVDYLTFPNGNLFGYYEHLPGSFLYHFDMGFEYVLPSNDAIGDVYLYDFLSGHWWYTGPTLFPYLYDFTLNVWLLYEIDPSRPGHYTTNPRSFASTVTHVVFTM